MAIDYPITAESLDVMLRLTRITSAGMRQALHDHLVNGLPKSTAAARHGIAKQQLGPSIKNILTNVKPAFDAYTAIMLNAQVGSTPSDRDRSD